MSQSINLIPRQELEKQAEVKVLNLSTIVSFVLLGIVSIVSIYLLINTTSLKRQISTLDSSISSLRSNIKSLSSIEIMARNLDKKNKVLSAICKDRFYYSKLMEELNARKPQGVNIVDLNLRENNTLNISGKADNYILVAEFTNTLLDKSFSNGNATLKDVFGEVTLNSVNLENKGGGVNFSITVEFTPQKLKEVL
jgi:Tfp pilus assembly protein PilN